jgi:isopenicillin-N N-acyltransferase like protein
MVSPRVLLTALLLVASTLVATVARADEPFRYPEAKNGKGELRYVNKLPVLLVQGTPDEIGEQLGNLALKPASKLLTVAEEFKKSQRLEQVFPLLLKAGTAMAPQFPPRHLKELEAAAKASGWSRDLLVLGNTFPDLRKLGGCSALIVESGRSATGGPLFGRNLDWRPFGTLHEYTLVVVCRPEGKHAFASIVYPGMFGCVTGFNDAGLTLADLSVYAANDGSAKFDAAGTPYTLALRRVLEECSTVEEAEKLLRSLKRTTMLNVAICDKKRGAVFEITTKNIIVRGSFDDVCACTNHFRTRELATYATKCERYAVLEKSRESKTLTVADMAKKMGAVHQGETTLQTMVIETSALKLHLAFGKGPATRFPLRTLDLGDLFAKGWNRK